MRLLFAKNKAILRPLPKRSVNHFRDWLPENSLPDRSGGRIGYRMPLHLERIAWMPSPPLAPDDGPIDMDHLQRMTLGDAGLEREVLTMFSAQAVSLFGWRNLGVNHRAHRPCAAGVSAVLVASCLLGGGFGYACVTWR